MRSRTFHRCAEPGRHARSLAARHTGVLARCIGARAAARPDRSGGGAVLHGARFVTWRIPAGVIASHVFTPHFFASCFFTSGIFTSGRFSHAHFTHDLAHNFAARFAPVRPFPALPIGGVAAQQRDGGIVVIVIEQNPEQIVDGGTGAVPSLAAMSAARRSTSSNSEEARGGFVVWASPTGISEAMTAALSRRRWASRMPRSSRMLAAASTRVSA